MFDGLTCSHLGPGRALGKVCGPCGTWAVLNPMKLFHSAMVLHHSPTHVVFLLRTYAWYGTAFATPRRVLRREKTDAAFAGMGRGAMDRLKE